MHFKTDRINNMRNDCVNTYSNYEDQHYQAISVVELFIYLVNYLQMCNNKWKLNKAKQNDSQSTIQV